MKDSINMFDRELNDRLSNEELPFDSKAWEMMEDKLDDKRRGLIFWNFNSKYFFVAIGLLLLSTAIYWPFHDDTSTSSTSNIETTDKQHEVESSIQSKGENTRAVESIIEESTFAAANQSKAYYYKVDLPEENPTKTFSESEIKLEASELVFNKNARIAGVGINDDTQITGVLQHVDTKSGSDEGITSSLNSKVENRSIVEDRQSRNQLNAGLDNIRLIDSRIEVKNRISELDAQLVDVDIELEEKIIRPKNQINFALGAGMTQLDIDDPYVGDITPVATSRQEYFYSLSYLRRVNQKFGFEIGVQGVRQKQNIGHYFEAGDYGLTEPQYGSVGVNAYEEKYEVFSNLHFFLPLDERSELDFYVGYYALNPLVSSGTWKSSSNFAMLGLEGTDLIGSTVSGEHGIFGGGRIKLGLNYNFLTNKRNTVGVGISYMHEVVAEVDGTYQMFQTSDDSKVMGNLRASGSGFKIQLNYGFGMNKKYSQNKTSSKLKNPWYLGARWGTKRFLFKGGAETQFQDLSKILIVSNTQRYSSIYLGHYIKKRIALEFGAEYFFISFSTPSDLDLNPTRFRGQIQEVFSIPLALRYDIVQTGRLKFYGKGVFSTDFKIPSHLLFDKTLGQNTSTSKLNLNAGIEAGIDFRLFKGLHLGVQGKYNHAFSNLARFQYPKSFEQDEFIFEDINLKNSYISWGVELKYYFNN